MTAHLEQGRCFPCSVRTGARSCAESRPGSACTALPRRCVNQGVADQQEDNHRFAREPLATTQILYLATACESTRLFGSIRSRPWANAASAFQPAEPATRFRQGTSDEMRPGARGIDNLAKSTYGRKTCSSQLEGNRLATRFVLCVNDA